MPLLGKKKEYFDPASPHWPLALNFGGTPYNYPTRRAQALNAMGLVVNID